MAELAGQREVWIAKVPFAVLLVAHHAAGTTGTLRARRGPVDKRVVLERGHPVDCRSNLVHETLSRYLAAIGRLPEETAIACLSKATARGVRVGEVLIADGLLDAAELTRILQQNLAKKLLDLFTWPDGEVTVEVGPGRGDSTSRSRSPTRPHRRHTVHAPGRGRSRDPSLRRSAPRPSSERQHARLGSCGWRSGSSRSSPRSIAPRAWRS